VVWSLSYQKIKLGGFVEYTIQHEEAAAVLYQVLGHLLDETGRFDTDIGELILGTALWLSGVGDEEAPDFEKILPFPPV
jgi:hypothetical protein